MWYVPNYQYHLVFWRSRGTKPSGNMLAANRTKTAKFDGVIEIWTSHLNINFLKNHQKIQQHSTNSGGVIGENVCIFWDKKDVNELVYTHTSSCAIARKGCAKQGRRLVWRRRLEERSPSSHFPWSSSFPSPLPTINPPLHNHCVIELWGRWKCAIRSNDISIELPELVATWYPPFLYSHDGSSHSRSEGPR